jgi:hypothetical protein
MIGATIDNRPHCDAVSRCRVGEAALRLTDNVLGQISFDVAQDEASSKWSLYRIGLPIIAGHVGFGHQHFHPLLESILVVSS